MTEYFIQHPWILILIFIWTLPWKAIALWVSARKGHLGWFLVLLLLNTLAVLDILYIYVFSKEKKSPEEFQPTRQPRVQNFQTDELLQKKLQERERQNRILEAKQARYANDSKKRLTVL